MANNSIPHFTSLKSALMDVHVYPFVKLSTFSPSKILLLLLLFIIFYF